MQKILKEIVTTPLVYIENEPIEDDMLFPDMTRLRRTHKMFCRFCNEDCYGDVLYVGTTRSRLCLDCKTEIKQAIRDHKIYLHKFIDIMDNMEQVKQQIIEIGMHPDRIRQTLLAEYLHLFNTTK